VTFALNRQLSDYNDDNHGDVVREESDCFGSDRTGGFQMQRQLSDYSGDGDASSMAAVGIPFNDSSSGQAGGGTFQMQRQLSDYSGEGDAVGILFGDSSSDQSRGGSFQMQRQLSDYQRETELDDGDAFEPMGKNVGLSTFAVELRKVKLATCILVALFHTATFKNRIFPHVYNRSTAQ